MTKFNVSRHVSFSVDQVFAIAADVARYSEFVPLVRKSVISKMKTLDDGRVTFDAALTISYKKLGISEVLMSHVIVDKRDHTVTATSSEGMVTHLATQWKVTPSSLGGSEVSLNVDYTLKSRSLQFLMSGLFDLMVRKVMAAFEERARRVYAGGTGAAA
jgi:coenzyme Q-binding protein COQ10